MSQTASSSSQVYSDGECEEVLLNFFASRRSPQEIDEFRKDHSEWEYHYHLSPDRECLLNWLDFPANASLLEIGAGCGALTGLFARRCRHVTASELSPRRAEILRRRHIDAENIELVVGDFRQKVSTRKFDLICVIGVLEYVERYSTHPNAALEFLSFIKSRLASGGRCLLAIENKFGLKYWAGCREDHTGRWFESIDDYQQSSGIRTYSRHELAALFGRAGFLNQSFFYPLPDYKFPLEVFSDEYLPTSALSLKHALYPTPDLSSQRIHMFDEYGAIDGIIRANSFPFFANSFLVQAS